MYRLNKFLRLVRSLLKRVGQARWQSRHPIISFDCNDIHWISPYLWVLQVRSSSQPLIIPIAHQGIHGIVSDTSQLHWSLYQCTTWLGYHILLSPLLRGKAGAIITPRPHHSYCSSRRSWDCFRHRPVTLILVSVCHITSLSHLVEPLT